MARISTQLRYDRNNHLWNALFDHDMPLRVSWEAFEQTIVESVKLGLWKWYNEVLRKQKFEAGARQKYGYAPRSKRYSIIKRIRKPKGGLREPPLPDLVWTGRWEVEAKSSPRSGPKARLTQSGVRGSVTVRFPVYVAQNRHHRMLAEVTRWHDDDLKMVLAEVARNVGFVFGVEPAIRG